MGEEKRKTARAEEATENPHKSPRLDTEAEALLQLGDSPSTGEAEATNDDSADDFGSCEHLYRHSEELDEIVRDLKKADKPPTCEHYPCGTTSRGAAGMMVCTECSYTFCIGEDSDRDNPRGHARWHASSDEHWVAMWCDEPSKGYCFECRRALMFGRNKAYEDDYALVARNKKDDWGTVASSSKDASAMLARNGNVDWLSLGSNPMDSWGTVGSNIIDPWGAVGSNIIDPWRIVGSNTIDQWGMVGTSAMDHLEMVAGDDHVIRGIPNIRNTCYMNASLQCLLALGKLRTMILGPDAQLGEIGLHLRQLFVETSSGNDASYRLDPQMIVGSMLSLYEDRFKPGRMEDSHEFLTSLYEQFPTIVGSIFSCELIQTISCKSCSRNSVTLQPPSHGLQLALPPKDPPARTKPFQVDSTEVKDTVHGHLQTQNNDFLGGLIEEQIKALDYIPKLFDAPERVVESTADSHNPEEKEKAQSSDIVHDEAEHMNSLASMEACLKLFSHSPAECNCSKIAAVVPGTNETKNAEPVMASTNVNTTVDGEQTELPDRKSCPSERSSDFSSLSVESPSRQPYHSDSHHQVILSEEIISEEVTSGKSCGEKDLATCSTANEKAEIHEGVEEDGPSCLTTDEQTDLMTAQDIQDASTQKPVNEKQVKYDHSAQQVAEKQQRQTDSDDKAIQTLLISKLPPVLTIQLKRFAPHKLHGHVSFKEILHVGPFMDPSSKDKDKSRYRLVGVVEHIGPDVRTGHYNAYVRSSRKQQGSGPPSSWVCASDSIIRRVSLEEVLRSEAYILFYERIDD